jgi:SAM-dependent methyltransferase
MTHPPQNPSQPVADDDLRLDSAAFHRNHEPIWAVLSRWIEDKPGNVLEVGSGTGQHVIEFARKSPHLLWWPTDYDERNIESIDAWRRHAHPQNVEAARKLDLCAMEWGLNEADSATLSDLTAIFCANVLHISPWRTTRGLMWGASQRLHPGGRLFLYGPFKQDGRHIAESNEAFDASLRTRNPEWGVRDIGDIRAIAHEHGLMLVEIEPMPANNMILIFENGRADAAPRMTERRIIKR